ncbi:hypothetical protein [Parabacteroides sp. ZJ-118]|uniref:hypothetical protein n=1 Tax=Parabacteroides sp. ZJ-118 TaxID=2709398 RepID=UPI0013ED4BA1|nr:hypothetical protein [Parabacteroides sp. ZJ-118]
MEAIVKKDNVYVYVDGDCSDEEGLKPYVVIKKIDQNYAEKQLYGRRVVLSTRFDEEGCITIDGISIKQFSYGEMEGSLPLESVIAYLNQIENLGVDTFLDNYKKALQELKVELNGQADKLEQELALHEDENKEKQLTKLRTLLKTLIALLFALSVNMNAGLDNHVYVDTYEYFINTYFNV